MFSERSAHKGMIGIQQGKHAAVFLEQIDEEAHGLLLHVCAQGGEGGACRTVLSDNHRHAELGAQVVVTPFTLGLRGL